MIRQRVIASLHELAVDLGAKAEGTQWHLFGSVDRDEPEAADIDLMILCKDDQQADSLRQTIDPDAFFIPLHLALMTFDEAAEVDAIVMQRSHSIFPCKTTFGRVASTKATRQMKNCTNGSRSD